jgi:hypothetical protein
MARREHAKGWKQLYFAALFENQRAQMPRRISEASRAIATRRLALLKSPSADDYGERRELDHASQALDALSACLEIPRPSAA